MSKRRHSSGEAPIPSRPNETIQTRLRRLATDARAHALRRATQTQEDRHAETKARATRRALQTPKATQEFHLHEVQDHSLLHSQPQDQELVSAFQAHTRAHSLHSSKQHDQDLQVDAQAKQDNKKKHVQHQGDAHGRSRDNEAQHQKIYQVVVDSLQHADLRRREQHLAAVQLKFSDNITEHSCGTMTEVCASCGAIHFFKEKVGDHFNSCCHNGKVILDDQKQLKFHPALKELMTANSPDGHNFRENICKYNSSFAMVSVAAKIKPVLATEPNSYHIHGAICHCISNIDPAAGISPIYGQLYFIDKEQALRERLNQPANSSCFPHIMAQLQEVIHTNNPFAAAYRTMSEIFHQEEHNAANEHRTVKTVYMPFLKTPFEQRRCNLKKAATPVAAVFVGDDGEAPRNINFTINTTNHNLQRINNTSSLIDPMAYPLLFIYGDFGWHDDEPQSKSTRGRNKVTMLQFYSSRFAVRPGFSAIHSAGKLFQQYILDAYVKVEGCQLDFFRRNQQALYVEQYQGLHDHVDSLVHQNPQPGPKFILPSTFPGSPKNMQQNFQDALAMIRQYGRPDFSITFKCNPKWQEIIDSIEPWQQPQYRPDITARVFGLKLNELLDDFIKKGVLGIVFAYTYVIKFQKIGLPQAHILLIMKPEDKPRDPEAIDKIISAEIPSATTHPRLFNLVTKFMIHGPCGDLNPNAVCMDKKCRNNFPKPFAAQTEENKDGYPVYRRRQHHQRVLVKGLNIDNHWVVPYNPNLLLKYNAYINIEICSSMKSIKYILDYIYQGHDNATIKLEIPKEAKLSHSDEISAYINSRSVCPAEAMWRLLEKKLYDQSHSIYRLAVHLPLKKLVGLLTSMEQRALQQAYEKDTTLTAWFKLNQQMPEARQYLYSEIPLGFTFSQGCQWNPRIRGEYSTLSRMHFVSPADPERYFLRLLLLHVRGARSFRDLYSFNETLYPTFHDAAAARHLLEDGMEWDNCLSEAAPHSSPSQLRFLFVIISVFGSVADPLALWNKFSENLIEDFVRLSKPDPLNNALLDIEEKLLVHNMKCVDLNLPIPVNWQKTLSQNPSFDVAAEALIGQECYQRLNDDQRTIANTILASIDSPHKRNAFFVDGPAGTGKTFLYKTIMHILRGRGLTVLPVAWTEIAASLLEGGQTCHSRFGFPNPILANSTSSISPSSQDAAILKECSMILWDEAPMIPGHALIVFDNFLRDLMNNDILFGGKVVVFAGDFRQVLPVVPSLGTAIISTSIKFCILWPQIIKLQLKVNMRTSADQVEFSKWLLDLGNNSLDRVQGLPINTILLPDECVTEGCLIDHVFGLNIDPNNIEKYQMSAILCTNNDECFDINSDVLKRLPGASKHYFSIDSAECDDLLNYPLEFIHSLRPADLPPHDLELKVGAIVILICNFHTKMGICNGTRLVIRVLMDNVINAEVLTGESKGLQIFIPRVILTTSDTCSPFILKRRQFPLQLDFAMDINKSHGQTYDHLGLLLSQPVCSHGQLYVAFSRVRRLADVKVKVTKRASQGKFRGKSGTYTTNVVNKELLK